MDAIEQVAVIPWQRVDGGSLEVLLIRKVNGDAWGVPKGGIADHGNAPNVAARVECLEEAGADGRLALDCLGDFEYIRSGKKCHVRVLKMEVTGLRERYRERGLRERKWFSIDDAVYRVAQVPLGWIMAWKTEPVSRLVQSSLRQGTL